jgi:hypothetical protein
MSEALAAAENLRDFLAGIKTNDSLSESKLAALEQDYAYADKCVAILSGQDTRAINDLWREIQYLSQFFGGDYAQGANQRQLEKLLDELHTAVLEVVVSLRL